jgi:hypothetical protein
MKPRRTVLPHCSVIFRSRARRGADRQAGDRTLALLAGTKAPRYYPREGARSTPTRRRYFSATPKTGQHASPCSEILSARPRLTDSNPSGSTI